MFSEGLGVQYPELICRHNYTDKLCAYLVGVHTTFCVESTYGVLCQHLNINISEHMLILTLILFSSLTGD